MTNRWKCTVVLLAAALALPMHGFAGEESDGKRNTIKSNTTVTAPTDCKMKKKVNAPDANDKRKRVLTERTAAGMSKDSKVDYNPNALKHDSE